MRRIVAPPRASRSPRSFAAIRSYSMMELVGPVRKIFNRSAISHAPFASVVSQLILNHA
jgi:hypothetical protein